MYDRQGLIHLIAVCLIHVKLPHNVLVVVLLFM